MGGGHTRAAGQRRGSHSAGDDDPAAAASSGKAPPRPASELYSREWELAPGALVELLEAKAVRIDAVQDVRQLHRQ